MMEYRSNVNARTLGVNMFGGTQTIEIKARIPEGVDTTSVVL